MLEEHPDRKTLSILYIYTVTYGLLSEKSQSPQMSNLDLSCVAETLSVSDSKYAKLLDLNY